MATRLNKFLAPVLGIFLLLGLNFQVFAQTAETTENEGVQVIEGVSEMSPALVEDVKQEIADYLDDAAHRFRGLDTQSVIGMGAGMITGALLTDLLGGSGLITLTGMVAGGAAGIWAADNLF